MKFRNSGNRSRVATLAAATSAALLAAAACGAGAQGPATGLELFHGDPAQFSGITATPWGSGTITPDTNAIFSGNQSYKILTMGYFQGASLTFARPFDFGPYISNPDAYLEVTIRPPGAGNTGTLGGGGTGGRSFPGVSGGGASGGGGGRSFPGVSGGGAAGGGGGGRSFPGVSGGGAPGGGGRRGSTPGGTGAGGAGGGGGEDFASPGSGGNRSGGNRGGAGQAGGGQAGGGAGTGGAGGGGDTFGAGGSVGQPGGQQGRQNKPRPLYQDQKDLKRFRIVLHTTGGRSVEMFMDLSTATSQRDWKQLHFPISAIKGLTPGDSKIDAVRIFGDAPATFNLGNIKVVTQQSPITFTPVDEQIVQRALEYKYYVHVSGGITPLKVTWDWDASDGIQVEGEGLSASHTYFKAGDYVVTVTAQDMFSQRTAATMTFKVHVTP